MMALRLEQNQGLVHTLAPHLRQSLKILQVPAVELRNLVLEELQLNPVLEELPGKEISLEESLDEENYRGKTDLENDTEKRNSENEEYVSEDLDPVGTSKDSERRDFFLNALVYPTSLKEHLLRQARMMDLSEAQMEVIQYAVDSLDHRGFLTPTEADISRQTGQSLTTVQSALGALRSLEPVGIACTDTRSCLFTQLMAQG
ncbi:MAG: RNA polymerase sigma-54 factor, partial [Puniceicoccales bacterium]|nr:RNA polymerase sigma-54 factor [Puniceicoccales bacterium]